MNAEEFLDEKVTIPRKGSSAEEFLGGKPESGATLSFGPEPISTKLKGAVRKELKRRAIELEGAAAVGSSLVSWIPGGLATVAGALNLPGSLAKESIKEGRLPRGGVIKGLTKAAEQGRAVQEAFTYEPKLFPEETEEFISPASKPFEYLAEKGLEKGEAVQDIVQDSWAAPAAPYLATAVHTFIEGLPFIVGLGRKGFKAQARRYKAAQQEGSWQLKVLEGVEIDIANGNFTPSQIKELWKNPKNREALLRKYQGVGAEPKAQTAPLSNETILAQVKADLEVGGVTLGDLAEFAKSPEAQKQGLTKGLNEILVEAMGREESPLLLPPGQGFKLVDKPFVPKTILRKKKIKAKGLAKGVEIEGKPVSPEERRIITPRAAPKLGPKLGPETPAEQISRELSKTRKKVDTLKAGLKQRLEVERKFGKPPLPVPAPVKPEDRPEPTKKVKGVVRSTPKGKKQTKEPWEMTKDEFIKKEPLPQKGKFDPKIPIKSEGRNISAVKLDDGSIYYDTESKVHAEMIDSLKIPPERIVEGGFIIGKKYVSGGANAAQIGAQNLAKRKTEHIRTVDKAISENKPVPKKVLDEYPDLKPVAGEVEATHSFPSKFKNTGEAVSFGRGASEEQVQKLKDLRKVSLAKIDALKTGEQSKDKMNERALEVFESQMFREAIQSSEGAEYLKDVETDEAFLAGLKADKKIAEAPKKPSPFDEAPNMNIARVQARKQPDGKWKLFYQGTRNEFFPGEVYSSAAEARNAFKVEKARFEAEVKPVAKQPKVEKAKGKEEPKIEESEASKKPNVNQARQRIIDGLKDQRGSFSLKQAKGPSFFNDLVFIGKDAMNKGATTYTKFVAQMKKTLGDVWAKIKNIMAKVFAQAKKLLRDERGAVGKDIKKGSLEEYIKGIPKGGEIKGRPKVAQYTQKLGEKIKESVAKELKIPQIEKMIKEHSSLIAGIEKAKKEMNVAFKAGDKTGHARAKLKYEELKQRQKRVAEIKKLGKRIAEPPSSGIDFYYREAIEALQEGIDPNFRTKKTLEKRERTRQFLMSHPEKIVDMPVKLLKLLNKKPLKDFSLEDLELIDKEIQMLKKLGALKKKQKVIKEQRFLDKKITEMVEGIKGVRPFKSLKPPLPIGAVQKKGKLKKAVRVVRATTLNPPRLFDKIDGEKNFEGPVHDFFYNIVNEKESGKLKKQDERYAKGKTKLKELGITTKDLGEPRVVGGNSWTVDALIDVYIGEKNPRKKLAIIHGNLGGKESLVPKLIDSLTSKEKAFGDFLIEEYSENYNRYREAHINLTNEDIGYEVSYSPIRRTEVNYTTLEAEIADELLHRTHLKKGYPERGSTKRRVDIPAEYQKPISLGAYRTWQSQVPKQEHYIGYGEHVKRMHRILDEGRVAAIIGNKFGIEYAKEVKKYVDRVANPYIYKSFDAIESASRLLRQHTALAYLSFNLVTMGKQFPSVSFFLKDAGPAYLMAAAADVFKNPLKAIQEVRELEPQIKHRSLERELEELKALDKSAYEKIIGKIGKSGMKGIYAIDKLAVTIGYKAVYNKAISERKSVEEAKRLALNSVLRTQPAANVKDIPSLYATSEYLNWFLMFTNQLNKIYNIATHDVPASIKNKRYGDAMLSVVSLGIAAVGIYIMTKKEIPETLKDLPEFIAKAVLEQVIAAIPLVGRQIASAKSGWGQSDVPAFKIVEALGVLIQAQKPSKRPLTASAERDRRVKAWKRKAGAVGEGLSIATGFPYTGTRRIYRALKEQDPWELIGIKKQKQQQQERLERRL